MRFYAHNEPHGQQWRDSKKWRTVNVTRIEQSKNAWIHNCRLDGRWKLVREVLEIFLQFNNFHGFCNSFCVQHMRPIMSSADDAMNPWNDSDVQYYCLELIFICVQYLRWYQNEQRRIIQSSSHLSVPVKILIEFQSKPILSNENRRSSVLAK